MNKLVAISTAAAIPTIAPAMPSADPIFAAIEEFSDADLAVTATFKVDPEDENLVENAWRRRDAAYDHVLRTRPTTPGGLGALTTWVRQRMDELRKHGSSFEPDKLYAISVAVDDATRSMGRLEPWSPPPTKAAVEPKSPDQELIALGQRFEELTEKYEQALELEQPREQELIRAFEILEGIHAPNRVPKDVRDALSRRADQLFPPPSPTSDELFEAFRPIADRMFDITPTTLEGFKAKALLVHHWRSHVFQETEPSYWPAKVARRLMGDLIGYEPEERETDEEIMSAF